MSERAKREISIRLERSALQGPGRRDVKERKEARPTEIEGFGARMGECLETKRKVGNGRALGWAIRKVGKV